MTGAPGLRLLLGALVRTYEDIWGDTDGDPMVPLSDVIRDLQAVLDGKPTQVGRVP